MRHRKSEAWAKWRVLVAEQNQSGQGVAAFCRERGLRSGQFFAWKKRLREVDAGGPGEDSLSAVPPVARFVAVEVAADAETKRPAPAMHGGAIEVRLGRSRSLVVERGFDAHHLRALLSVLEAEA